jgi:hypothetical protein
MPCACRVPFELYPESAEWGPILWRILHGLAERSGKPTSPMYAEDERRAWIHFFKETGEIIPCPMCKEHYKQYLEHNPVTNLKSIPISYLHDWVRDWFWELHEWVNETLKKPSFSKEELHATYDSIPLRTTLKMLEAPMKRAITLSGNNAKKFMEWKGRFNMILSILGI